MSNLSDWAFAFFIERSLTLGIGVLLVFLAVFLISWAISNLIKEMRTTTKMRHILLGISMASLLNFMVNLALNAHKGVMGGGIIEMPPGPPYLTIMGVPFGTIIWSLFLGSLFATIERLIKVWEEL